MYVYFIFNKLTGNYKIGKAKDPNSRIKQLQTGNEVKLKIERLINDVNPEIEKYLHAYFKEKRIQGGEWFNINIDDVDYAISIVGYANKVKSGKEKLKQLPDDKDNKLIDKILKYKPLVSKKSSTSLTESGNYQQNFQESYLTLKEFGLLVLCSWILLMIIKIF
jgi:hypothetical protein